MQQRITENVRRGADFTILFEGEKLAAFDGETVAAVLTAAGVRAFRQDKSGHARAPFCNMGVCFECLLYLADGGGWKRIRSCMVAARPDMVIRRVADHDGSAGA